MTITREEQLEILRNMTDEEIDYSDASPTTDNQLKKVTAFVPPEKRANFVKIDKDIYEWFKKKQPEEFHLLINTVLRKYIISQH